MEFTINKEYAEKYNKWREKEEYQKLKDRYGDISEGDSDDSSTSESEDEDAEGLTPQLEKDWLKTLAAIKSKNPKIYNKDVQFYHQRSESSDESSDVKRSKKSDKPMYLKDYERKVIMEKGGKLSDEDSSNADADNEDKPGYYEEQEEIRNSILAADVSSNSDEEFLTKRKKSKEQLEKEEADYIEWLKGQKEELSGEDEKAGVELNPLKNYWNDPQLPEGERFLRDYILNKRYLEEDEGLPTYDEIVDFSEEEEQLEKEETFEHKYNFRFEDPDTEFIKSYPRTINDTVRRKDSKRAEKRQEVKDRKQKEKDKIKEEIKQLKNLKKREIESRVHQLKEVTGEEGRFNVEDLEGDFDPEAHDKLMKKMFSSDFYDEDVDDEKPMWSDDGELDLEVPNWDRWKGSANVSNPGDEEGDSASDDSEDSEAKSDLPAVDISDRELDASKTRHKKTKFQKVIEAKKPAFDPGEKSFAEYLDEYYKLDYEDIVAGQPCRFRYRNVVSNDFGLSTDEVLSAKETELNRWVSLKKMSQYRTEEEEKLDVRIFGKKGRDVKKKRNVLPSLVESEQTPENTKTDKKKRRRKKKKPENIERQTSSSPAKRKAEDLGTGSAKKRKLSRPEIIVKETVTSSTTNNVINSNSKKQTSDSGKKSKKKKKKDKDKIRQTANNTDSKEDRGFKSTATTLSDKDKNSTEKLNKKKAAKLKDQKKKKPKKSGLLSEERLKAYGINPKKFKYTQKNDMGKT